MKDINTKQEEVYEFQIADLLGIAMTFVVIGIGVAFGLNVQSDVRDDFTTNSYEYNATQASIVAVKKIPDKMGLIITVVLAAVIIGILTRYLFVRFG